MNNKPVIYTHQCITFLTYILLHVQAYYSFNDEEQFLRKFPTDNSTRFTIDNSSDFKAIVTCPNICLDGNNCSNDICRNCFFSCPRQSCRLQPTTCEHWCTQKSQCNQLDQCRGCMFCKEFEQTCPIAKFKDVTSAIVMNNETYWNQWLRSGKPFFHAGAPVFVDIDGDNRLDYFNSMHGSPVHTSFENGLELGIAIPSEDSEINYRLEFYTGRIFCTDQVCDESFTDKHGSIVADLDDDGYLDIYISNGGGGPLAAVNPEYYSEYDNWLFWGEPRFNTNTGQNITVFIGGREAAQNAGIEMQLGRSRFNYLLDANSDGLLDIFSSHDRRISNIMKPGILLINQGDRTWKKDVGLSEYARTMMLTDADGDGLAQEFILNRSFCYPFRKGPDTDPKFPSIGPYSFDVKQFCHSRPVGTNAIYRFNHTSNQMEEISNKYQNFWAGSKWTDPCCTNGSFDTTNNCNAVSMGSGDFDNDQKADHILLYGEKLQFFFSSDRHPGEMPDNRKHLGLEIKLPKYCSKARSLQIFDLNNDGKQELLVLCRNVGTLLLYTQGESKTSWTLQNGCNGNFALGAINNRFLVYPTDEEMKIFCDRYSGIDWAVADDVCKTYKRTGKFNFVQADGLAVVDINQDGFQDIVTIGSFGHLRFFFNEPSSETLDNRFISFKMKGDVNMQNNRYGIGATIILFCRDVESGTLVKQFREISSHQHHHDIFSTKDDKIVFGLGKRLKPLTILVRWSSGRSQKLRLGFWEFSKVNNPIEIMDTSRYFSARMVKLKQNIKGSDYCLGVVNVDEEAKMLPCGGAKIMKWRMDRQGRLFSRKFPKHCLVPNFSKKNLHHLVLHHNCKTSWCFSTEGHLQPCASRFLVRYHDYKIHLSWVKNATGSQWEVEPFPLMKKRWKQNYV